MTRWFAERSKAEREEYAAHFRSLSDSGIDIDGEARFVDAMADRGARILDAGCGTGRVAAALQRRGHDVLGVDIDPVLIAAGQELHPGLPLQCKDLRDLGPLARSGDGAPFDLIVAAGNVMVFLEPGSEVEVLQAMRAVAAPGARLVLGFATDRAYSVADLDRDAASVGWSLEHRFGTWNLDPFETTSDWAVSVFRLQSPP